MGDLAEGALRTFSGVLLVVIFTLRGFPPIETFGGTEATFPIAVGAGFSAFSTTRVDAGEEVILSPWSAFIFFNRITTRSLA